MAEHKGTVTLPVGARHLFTTDEGKYVWWPGASAGPVDSSRLQASSRNMVAVSRSEHQVWSDGQGPDRRAQGSTIGRAVKPLIIGQAPARGNDDKPAFSGASGARLAKLAGVDDLWEHFDTVNLIPTWPGKAGAKGDSFDMKLARQRAMELILNISSQPPRHILIMGRKVRKAMGLNGEWRYLEEFVAWGSAVVIFPHPSGINHWWNLDTNVQAAAEYLRGLVHGETTQG